MGHYMLQLSNPKCIHHIGLEHTMRTTQNLSFNVNNFFRFGQSTGGSITENIDMSLYAFPSFHVRDRFKSAVPAIAFTLGMRNKADKPLDVSFMFNLPLGQQEDTIRVGDNYGEVVFTRCVRLLVSRQLNCDKITV